MVFSTNVISIGSDATLILSSNVLQNKRVLQNLGVYSVYLGSDSGVTIDIGFPISVGEEFVFNDYNGNLYGIIDVADSTVNQIQYLEDQ